MSANLIFFRPIFLLRMTIKEGDKYEKYDEEI